MEKFKITDLIYIMELLKVIKVNLTVKRIRLLLHRAIRCGKSTLLKSLNRMNDLIEGCRIDARLLMARTFYGNIDVNLLRKRVGMVFKPNNR